MPGIPIKAPAKPFASAAGSASAARSGPITQTLSQLFNSIAGLGKPSVLAEDLTGSTRHTSADEEITRDYIPGHQIALNNQNQQPTNQPPAEPPADGFTARQI